MFVDLNDKIYELRCVTSISGILIIVIVSTLSPNNPNKLVTLYTFSGSIGLPGLRSAMWAPDESKIAFISWDTGPEIIIVSYPSGEEIKRIKMESGARSGFIRWNSNQELLLYRLIGYKKKPENFYYSTFNAKISRVDINNGKINDICIIDKTEFNFDNWKSLICPTEVQNEVDVLFGDPRRRMYGPTYAINNDRFYFYTADAEGYFFYKAWIEGFDKNTGKRFHVKTITTEFPYIP